MSHGVRFLVLNLLLELSHLFPITRSSSSVQTTYVGTVFFQFSSSETRAPPSLTSQTATAVGRSQVYADDGMYPQGSYSSTSLVQCHHHFAQQLLLFTVVTLVVTGSTLLRRLVVTLVVCTGPWVGARCLPAGSFRVKAGPRRRLAHNLFSIQPSRLHDTPPTWRHAHARTSSPCSQQSRVASLYS